MKVRHIFLTTLAMTLAVVAHGAKPVQDFSIGLSPDFFSAKTSEAARMLWLIYANARVKFAEAHRTEVFVEGQRVVPSFLDELSARRETVTLYRKMKKEKPTITDFYWDQVDEIDAAGFLDEYVWVFLRRPNWRPDEEPKRLAEFDVYRKISLENHRATTLASVIVQ